jgi:hypothetical protein
LSERQWIKPKEDLAKINDFNLDSKLEIRSSKNSVVKKEKDNDTVKSAKIRRPCDIF